MRPSLARCSTATSAVKFEIIGNARGGAYRLEYGQGAEPTSGPRSGRNMATKCTMACWKSLIRQSWPKALYTLRLIVNRDDGERVWTTPVTIDNTPPTVMISEPKPDQLYVMEEDEQININVLPNDAWGIELSTSSTAR